MLKQVLVGAGIVSASGIVLVGYGVLTRNIDVFAIGGIITLAGVQSAINVHGALLRIGRSPRG